MALKAGIVGMPNVGKSTLFKAITKKNVLAANYPFATIDPNIGIVTVADERLDKLNEMYEPKNLVPAQYEFIDIAGLVKGASTGEGLGNKFLSHIREVDAIVHVIRCFEDENIIHVEGEVNPKRDIEIINLELMLSDSEIISNRIQKLEKKVKTVGNKEEVFEYHTLKKAEESLNKGTPLRLANWSDDEANVMKHFNFISLKPLIYLANLSEDDLIDDNKFLDELTNIAKKENIPVISMCAKIESELIELNEEDKTKFLNELNIEMSGLDRLIKTTYDLLGLKTFFTVGKDEVKAWTFKEGMKAPQCAGIIHTDFQRGFIKAEVTSYNDLTTYGNELKVKEAGKIRFEGKEYLVKDGDICYFRFNV